MKRPALLLVLFVAVATPVARAAETLPHHTDLRATMRMSPGPHLFGDTISAEIDVFVDPVRADPRSVRVDTSFGPFERTHYAHGRHRVEGLVEVWYRYTLVCLDVRCVPKGATRTMSFPPATVRYRGAEGDRKPTILLHWSPFRLLARAAASATSSNTFFGLFNGGNRAALSVFRTPSSPPPTKFRIPPTVLAVLLLLLAMAAVGVAGITSLPVMLHVRDAAIARRPNVPARTRIEEALDEVRRVAEREAGSPKHRESLARLARELAGANARDLVRPATRLAWSAEAPTRDASQALVGQVETWVNRARP